MNEQFKRPLLGPFLVSGVAATYPFHNRSHKLVRLLQLDYRVLEYKVLGQRCLFVLAGCMTAVRVFYYNNTV